MSNDIKKEDLINVLKGTFGKSQFEEDELTKEFWTQFYIAANKLYSSDEGINLDSFMSDSMRAFLLDNKS